MKQLILRIIDQAIKNKKIAKYIERFIQHYIDHVIFNINLDLSRPDQKRVLMVYDPLIARDVVQTNHAKYHHENQMIYYFISKGFAVDICCYNDKNIKHKIAGKNYQLIIGQGEAYRIACKTLPQDTQKILFCTENNPITVLEKYKERLDYFTNRHPEVNSNGARNAHQKKHKNTYNASENEINETPKLETYKKNLSTL